MYDYFTGTAVFDAYREKLSDDSEFAGKTIGELAKRKMVHYYAMTMIAEHSNGAAYLRDVAGLSAFAAAAGSRLLRPAAGTLDEACRDLSL